MAKVRKLPKKPGERVAYLVDANLLANRFIPPAKVKDAGERQPVERSGDQWPIIDSQMKAGTAVVYVLDVCIAEAFKVLAKKYYVNKVFASPVAFKNARDRLSSLVRTASKTTIIAFAEWARRKRINPDDNTL